ncbi:MAG: glycoside hydrolase family 2 TIM barrel-domain containing protein [Acidobacteriota bacterium]|nr:glycoside hydrolase family 2 TIM barrel-domain containing protein [Acidobacteriota bacterium]
MSDYATSHHPRPDMNRGVDEGTDWISLDGAWDFQFEATGAQEPPQSPASTPYTRSIRVPFPWQSHLAWGTEHLAGDDNWYSTEAFIDPAQANMKPREHGNLPQYEVGWYRRAFAVPEGWAGKRVILNIGAADWHVTVWCNGKRVGDSDSGYLPVSFDLTDALQPGENELVIRVFDPMDHAQKPVGKQWDWYTRTSGIWQPVWLEPRPEAHVASIKISPDVERGTAYICAQAENAETGDTLRVQAFAPDGDTTVCELELSDGWFAGELVLDQAILWTPETPELYRVTASLVRGGGVLDEVYTYFGMRTISVGPLYAGGPNYVLLNGEPVYLRGALDQSFNPWGVYSWADTEAARRDVELAKESGFNFLRIHIKLEDPRFLYWCDRLGILLQCDLPSWGYSGYSDIARERHEAMLRGAVKRDFNHPCIFSWCLFNETWGLGNDRDFQAYKQAKDRQEYVADLYRLAKELDPTRLIEDQSPCHYDHVVTDLNSWHYYINDYEKAREHVEQVVAETYPGSGFNYVPGRVQGDEPLMNSEYGGISAGMGDMDVSWCFRFLTTDLRRHEKICGYVYTELQDIEWERNGFYNYDRSPKEFGYDPSLLQGAWFVGFHGPPARTLAPEQVFDAGLFVSCMEAPESSRANVQLTATHLDSLGRETSVGEATVTVQGLTRLGVFDAAIPEALRSFKAPGLVTLEARIPGQPAWNCTVLEIRDGRLPALETDGAGRVILRKLAGEFETSTAWHEAEVERGKVGEEQHLIAGVGAGHIDYRFELPEGFRAGTLTLLFEASSKRPGAPQTSEDRRPSDLRITVNGAVLAERTLGDQYADSRGALSHMHGFHGRYGELVTVEFDAGLVGNNRVLDVRLEVPADACHRNGLTVYSSRAGRFPCDITLSGEPSN